jgi:hypothetical protein
MWIICTKQEISWKTLLTKYLEREHQQKEVGMVHTNATYPECFDADLDPRIRPDP